MQHVVYFEASVNSSALPTPYALICRTFQDQTNFRRLSKAWKIQEKNSRRTRTFQDAWEMVKRWVLRCDRKTGNESAEVTCWSKLFQIRAAATGKARSPTVDSRVHTGVKENKRLNRSNINNNNSII